MQSISEWLQSLGLDQYAQVFADNDIDLELLSSLSDQDLEKIGVSSLGHRKNLLKAIAELDDATVAAPSSPSTSQRLPIDSGERRQATVLFSDLSGFTAMTEKLDPEEVQGLMRRLKDGAVGIVESHGGIVSQFVGDEVLALFGIPTAHEDDPLRAVRAAQQIHALAQEFSPEMESKIGRPLAMHSGISTGLVLTSNADARDGTVGVTGDTVNTGARLKALATDDAILLSPETARQVNAYVKLETLESADLKGKQAQVTPYKVIGEVSAQSRFEAASAQRGFTAFTGRERELAQLNWALERAAKGEGQFVTMIGEAGAGKSRAIHEFRQSVNRAEVTVLEGRCQSYGATTPYLPLLDVLRRGLRLNQVTEADAIHDTAVTNIRNISPDLKRYLPHLLQLLSIASDEHKLPDDLQGDALRRELEESLAAIITLTATQKPLALILEDWHWADEASDTTLNHLLGLVGHYPLMLIVLYRPEYERKWADVENYTALVLHSLDVTQTANMLASVLGADSLPGGLPEAVHARTGGNALFNEEIAYALRDEGMVAIADGTATLTRPVDELVLPDTVHAVIRTRVDRLDSDDREVLRLASVIGREFDRAVLERIAQQGQDVSAALERLSRQNLVHQVRVVPQAEYLFKHVLTQEVVYETLLLSQRKALHAQVGAAIEGIYVDRLEERYEALADHYSKAAVTDKAVEYLAKAGDKAAEMFIITDAITRYRGVLDRTHALGSDQSDLKQLRVNVTIKLILAGYTQPSPEFFGYIEESIRYARDLDDESGLAHLVFCIGRLTWTMGNLNEGYGQLLESQALARSSGQHELERTISSDLVNVCAQTARIEEALRHMDFVRDGIEARTPDFNDNSALVFGAWAETARGNFPASSQFLASAKQNFESEGNTWGLAWVQFWVGLQHQTNGNWQLAGTAYTAAIPLFVAMGDLMGQGLCIGYPGHTRYMMGEGIPAWDDIREGKQLTREGGSKIGVAHLMNGEAEMLLLQGDAQGVVSITDEILELVGLGSRWPEARTRVLRGMARALGNADDPQEVLASVESAIQLASKRLQRPDEAWGRFRYAEILHNKGELETAREQLGQAEALFHDMGMDWWTEQAQGLRGRIDRGEPFKWFAPFVDGPPQGIEQH